MDDWCVKKQSLIYHSLLSSHYVALAVGRNHKAHIPYAKLLFSVLTVSTINCAFAERPMGAESNHIFAAHPEVKHVACTPKTIYNLMSA